MRPEHSLVPLKSVPCVEGDSDGEKTGYLGWQAGKRVRGYVSYSREVLVDIFCRLLKEAFKLIPSPL